MAITGQVLRLSPQSGSLSYCLRGQQLDFYELKGVLLVGCYQGREKYMGFIPPVEPWFRQSAYADFVVDVVDQDDNPVDISGSELVWFLFENKTSEIVLQKGTVAGTMTKSSATRVQWAIENDESQLFTASQYYHELWEINASGDRRLAMYGQFLIQDTRGFDV